MATSVSAKFSIKGDAQGAVKALQDFAKGITSLNTRLSSLAKKSDLLDKFNTSLNNMNKNVTSFSRRGQTAIRVANELAQAYQKLSSAMANQPAAATTAGTTATAVTPVVTTTAPISLASTSALTKALSGVRSVVGMIGMGVSAIGTGFRAVGTAVGTVGNFLTGVKDKVNGVLQGVNNFLTRFPQVFGVFRRYLMDMFDGLRLMTLGLTNIFRSVMFFISIPLSAAFYSLSRDVLDFDNQMKAVQKTSGMTNAQMAELIPMIRELGKTTSTSFGELGRITEQVGQLGVSVPSKIAELVNMTNMLIVSTDIAADQAALDLGRIANAFGYNLNESTVEVWKFINVLNRLENDTAATATEIMEATLKFAPVAKTMRLTTWQTAALGTAITSMGYDAGTAATALRNMGIYMIKNNDKVQQLLSSTAKYADKQSVAKAMNKDMLNVMLDFLNAASKEKDIVKAITAEFDVLNLRGGRAAASFSQNMEYLIKVLAIANDEYYHGSSILEEYDRFMSSTSNQLAVLRNNFTDLGITVGDTVLPLLNRWIQILIPAVQELTKWFKNLSSSTQMTIVAMLVFLAIGGPLGFFIAQVVHGIFLIGMGFSTLLKVIPTTVWIITKLIKGLAFLSKIFGGLRVVILVGVVAVLKVLQKMGVDIAGFFDRLADSALSWAENLAASYANGLLSGFIRWVGQALNAIGHFIARFLRSRSPPQQGPLSQIDKWGRSLMETYLRSFTEADFSILNDVGSVIERILTNLAVFGKISETDPFSFLMQARVNLAKLLKIFHETGKISDSVLSQIVSHLGDFGGKVRDLIKAWIEYSDVQQRLADIEKRRKGAEATLKKEMTAIAASSMSIEDKVAAMRKTLRQHNDELTAMDDEQTALEAQEDQLKNNLDWQQQFIRALTEQDDIQARLVQTLERLAKAAEKMGGGGGELEPFPGLGEGEGEWNFQIDPEAQQAIDALYNLPARINAGRIALQGFFDAVAGKPHIRGEEWQILSPEARQSYDELYSIGCRIRDVLITIRGVLDGIKQDHMGPEEFAGLSPDQQQRYDDIYGTFTNIYTTLDEIQGAFDSITNPTLWQTLGSTIGTSVGGAFEDLKKRVKDFFSGIGEKTGITQWLKPLKTLAIPGIGPLLDSFKNLWDATAELRKELGRLATAIWNLEFVQNIVKFFAGLGVIINWLRVNAFEPLGGLIAGVIVRSFQTLLTVVINLFSWIFQLAALIIGFAADLAEGKSFDEAWANLTKGLDQLGKDISEFFTGLWGNIKDDVIQAVTDIVSGFANALNEKTGIITTAATWLITTLINTIKGLLGIESPSTVLYDLGTDTVQGLIDGITNKWEELLTTVGTKVGEVIAKILAAVTEFFNAGAELRQQLENGFTNLIDWETFKTTVGGKVDEIVGKIVEKITDFYNAGVDLVNGLKDGIVATWTNLVEKIIPGLVQKVIKKIKGETEEDSPSKVTMRIGKNVALGFAKGVGELDSYLQGTYKTLKRRLPADIKNQFVFNPVTPRMPAFATVTAAQPIQLNVDIHDFSVRDDKDIDRIVREVERAIDKKLVSSNRFRGLTS